MTDNECLHALLRLEEPLGKKDMIDASTRRVDFFGRLRPTPTVGTLFFPTAYCAIVATGLVTLSLCYFCPIVEGSPVSHPQIVDGERNQISEPMSFRELDEDTELMQADGPFVANEVKIGKR